MKKFYHFLMLLMLSILLVGCTSSETSSKKEDKKTESTKKSKKKKKSKKDKKDKDKDTEADEDEEEENEETSETKKSKATSKSGRAITFEGFTAVDNEDCSITISGVKESEWDGGYDIDVSVENKSADVNYTFTLTSAAVNGVQADTSFYSDVLAGKKANSTIRIEDLSDYGITEYTDIELDFKVTNSDDWSADDILRETVHVYPYGEENAVQFTREAQASDAVLIDNELATITYIGKNKDSIYGDVLSLYVVNKTDRDIYVRVEDVSVDGYMTDPYYDGEVIKPGKSRFTNMYWSSSDDSGIDTANMGSVECTIKIRDEQYGGNDLSSDTVTITP